LICANWWHKSVKQSSNAKGRPEDQFIASNDVFPIWAGGLLVRPVLHVGTVLKFV
jgi:hypothetical protein